eukprot:843677-Pleurochrysis_carterae.AAC.2
MLRINAMRTMPGANKEMPLDQKPVMNDRRQCMQRRYGRPGAGAEFERLLIDSLKASSARPASPQTRIRAWTHTQDTQ